MDKNRPVSREKYVTDNSKGVQRRGEGLGTGPVGNGGVPHGGNSSGGAPKRSSGGRSPLGIIVALIIVLLGGGGAVGSFVGGGSEPGTSGTPAYTQEYTSSDTPVNAVDNSVAEGARVKYTKIIGNGQDTVTLMVYMCGTDLESKYGMATNDLNEMLGASFSDKVNLIVYTGGCTQWKNNTVSSSTNQIYQIKNKQLILIEDNLGSVSMTDPSTLSGFIQYCSGNFPANRYELILWDHGGGSVSGYGYDQKFQNSGSMSLSGINKALADGGVDFDFVGFDACLMATLENGLMLSKYADYMIASEETEPGVGWYYTNWLTELGNNTSIDTVMLGSRIVDDFVSVCARDAQGQKTTLSVVDLAELSATVPEKFNAFSANTADRIKGNEYQSIANARAGAREFAQSSKIDQVDLIDLAGRIGTIEAADLCNVVRGAVKYNRTSLNMTNANGISIYFPFRKLNRVDSALQTYQAIGLDSEYSRCIREYASLEVEGQAASNADYGNSFDPLASLLGSVVGGGQSSGGDELASLMGSLFFSGRELSPEEGREYVAGHGFNPSALVWTKDAEGNSIIALNDEQWDLLVDVEQNMFVDDGSGYIDMGLDNLFEIDDNGNLIAAGDKTWLAINGQPIAYYHLTSDSEGDSYTITGYVPALLNGERVNLILEFSDENPKGSIVGASTDYHNGETELQAKNLGKLSIGDTLEFICDYYSYNGEYQDSYLLGEPMKVTENMEISNVSVGDNNVRITYRFTDIYNNKYWSKTLDM